MSSTVIEGYVQFNETDASRAPFNIELTPGESPVIVSDSNSVSVDLLREKLNRQSVPGYLTC